MRSAVRRQPLVQLFSRALRFAFFVILPPVVVSEVLLVAARQDAFAVDFHHSFWPAGRAVLEHRSPFPHAAVSELAGGTAFVYPPAAALVMAPFALLPREVADILFTCALAAAAVGALRLCGVRDGRAYGVACLWPPVVFGLQSANISLLLTLGLALAWRFRDRTHIVAGAIGGMIALKLFAWPLLLWLAATRRRTEAAYAAGVAAAVTSAAWAVLGFAGASSYLDTVKLLSDLEAPASYTPFALGLRLGFPTDVSRLVGLVLGMTALGAVLVTGRRRRDDVAFGAAVLGSLLLSPVVWLHYFTLLLVPLAIRRRLYTGLWLLPLALWGFPVRPEGPSLAAGVAVAVAALVIGLSARPPGGRGGLPPLLARLAGTA